MKKTSIFAIIAFLTSTSLFAQDVYIYGAKTLKAGEAYKTSTTLNGKPWGGGKHPSNNQTVIYGGMYAGSWDTKDLTNNSFVTVDSYVEMGNFIWSTPLKDTTATFTFEKNQIITINGTFGAYASHAGSYRGITLDFKANEGVSGKIQMRGQSSWVKKSVDEVSTLCLNSNQENGFFTLKIGQGVTLDFTKNVASPIFKIVNNVKSKNSGSIELYNGGKLAAKRLDVFGSGNNGTNDIIIGENSSVNVETLAFKDSDARIEIAGSLITTKNVILNNTVTFEMQGENAVINFAGSNVNVIGKSAKVRILNFKENTIKFTYSDEAKKFIETKVTTSQDGKKWVNNLTLSQGGIVVFKK